MRKYKYYCVSYIINKKIFYVYLVDYEVNDFVYNLIVTHDIDYLCIKRINDKTFIDNF